MDNESFGERLLSVDWEDASAGLSVAGPLLMDVARSGLLLELLSQLPSSARLAAMCEHLQGIRKLVLYDDEALKVRLRLHAFGDYYADVAHNHRWSYASLVLRGGYEHIIHGEVGAATRPEDLRSMAAAHSSLVGEGSAYFLHHRMVHSLRVRPYSVSLILRGPVVRPSALWNNRASNETWVHQGSGIDPRKTDMTLGEVADLCSELRQTQLWPTDTPPTVT